MNIKFEISRRIFKKYHKFIVLCIKVRILMLAINYEKVQKRLMSQEQTE